MTQQLYTTVLLAPNLVCSMLTEAQLAAVLLGAEQIVLSVPPMVCHKTQTW